MLTHSRTRGDGVSAAYQERKPQVKVWVLFGRCEECNHFQPCEIFTKKELPRIWAEAYVRRGIRKDTTLTVESPDTEKHAADRRRSFGVEDTDSFAFRSRSPEGFVTRYQFFVVEYETDPEAGTSTGGVNWGRSIH